MQKMKLEFNTNEANNFEILAEIFPSCVTEDVCSDGRIESLILKN